VVARTRFFFEKAQLSRLFQMFDFGFSRPYEQSHLWHGALLCRLSVCPSASNGCTLANG